MKLIWTLTLVALAMAALTPALSSTVPVVDGTPVCPAPLAPLAPEDAALHTGYNTDLQTDFDSFERQCLRHCSVVLCANPQTCGVYTNPAGQRACGCH